MMPRATPRVVVVTRHTQIEQLVQVHGTVGQARFMARTRQQSLTVEERRHDVFTEALRVVLAAIPPAFRRAHIDRSDLDRFLFEPDDTVVVVGQDGLVPNTAKYLTGQLVAGINPDPAAIDGVLCRHRPTDATAIFGFIQNGSPHRYHVEKRTMAVATTDDGQKLLALNEVFVGHKTHQSARYRIRVNGKEERQSSSGLICATGTGATGWARSIVTQRSIKAPMPQPEDGRLAWFVREPFPTIATGTTLDFGLLQGDESIIIVSEMGENGVIFADGIESDNVPFLANQYLTIRAAEQSLNLIVPSASPKTTAEMPSVRPSTALHSPTKPQTLLKRSNS